MFFLSAGVTMLASLSHSTAELVSTPLLHASFIVNVIVSVFLLIFRTPCKRNTMAGSLLELYDHIPLVLLHLDLISVLNKHHDLDRSRVVFWAEILTWSLS